MKCVKSMVNKVSYSYSSHTNMLCVGTSGEKHETCWELCLGLCLWAMCATSSRMHTDPETRPEPQHCPKVFSSCLVLFTAVVSNLTVGINPSVKKINQLKSEILSNCTTTWLSYNYVTVTSSCSFLSTCCIRRQSFPSFICSNLYISTHMLEINDQSIFNGTGLPLGKYWNSVDN